MPTLLDVQKAFRKGLVDGDAGDAAAMLAAGVGADRLDIYRNTFLTAATNALRLCYPAVHRLVGADFFTGAAGFFIASNPPCIAYLDRYGAEFPQFLARLPQASGLAYLADVARLEWAVSEAVHAPELEPLAPAQLLALTPVDQGRVCLIRHPSVALLRTDYPADVIWRAVLDRDDVALAALDLAGPPIHLLVERRPDGVEVTRLDAPEWSFAAALCEGRPLQAALDEAAGVDAAALLADHLAAGRFTGFTLAASAEAGADPL